MKTHARKCSLFSAIIIMIFTCKGLCQDQDIFFRVQFSERSATEGSCAEIQCQTVATLRDSNAKWFWIKDSVWDSAKHDYVNITYVNSSNHQDVNADFAGRVTYTGSRPPWYRGQTCSIKICDLRKTDSGRYRFRYAGKTAKYSTTDTTLAVTENHCPITFTKPPVLTELQTISLICSTLPSCPSNPQINGLSAFTKMEVNTNDTKISNVTFEATWQDNGKELTCQAPNNNDQHLVKKINLTVEYAPKLVMARVNPQTVKERQTTTFICSAKGNPAPTFTWFKNGIRLSNQSNQWTIKQVKTEHGGSYYCEANNTFGSIRSQPLDVDVTYPPEIYIKKISPDSEAGKEKDQMILQCLVKRSNPKPSSYRWYKGSTYLHYSGSQYDKTLEQTDGGSYRCAAENSAGLSQRSQPVQIRVQYGPRKPNIYTVQSQVKVGDSVTLSCETTADPPPKFYTWYRHTGGITSRDGMSTERTLHLTKLKRGDDACYTCSATNDIKTGESSEEACVQVLYPPTNLQLLMDPEVQENKSVTISCTVESLPTSQLTLTADLPSGLLPTPSQHPNVLNYTFIGTPAHRGTYTCSASNGQGSSQSKSQELVVRYAPRDVRIQPSGIQTRSESSGLTLFCYASADPEASFSWWKVTPKAPELLQSKHSLVFNSLRVSDSGQYRCTASNHLGTSQSDLAEVKVKYAPKLTSIFRAAEQQQSDGKSSVTLSCSSHCYPPVNAYSWYRRVKDNPENRGSLVSSQQNFTVYSDMPGYYYCVTRNGMGERSSDSVPLFVEGIFIKVLKYILLSLFILILLTILIVTYRQRRSKSTRGNSKTSSLCFGFMNAGTNARTRMREPAHASYSGDELSYTQPTPQRPHRRPDVTPASELTVYSTVNLPATNPGTSTQKQSQQGGSNGMQDLLNYASLHFDKRQKTQEPKAEDNVVYSKVANRKEKEKPGDDYANVGGAPALKYKVYSWDSDSSEEETGLNYTQVNFPVKAEHSRPRTDSSSSEKEETNYSEVKF